MVSRLRAHDGLLFAYVPLPWEGHAGRFKPVQGGGESDDAWPEWTPGAVLALEIIDARSGELLASESYPLALALLRADSTFPMGMFQHGFLGYRYGEGPDGSPFVEVVELELVGKE